MTLGQSTASRDFRIRTLLRIAALTAVSLLSQFGSTAFSQDRPKDPVALYWPWQPDIGIAGVELARLDGAFARESIDLQLRTGLSEADTIKSVVSAPDAIGMISASQFLRARADGAPIVAFAAGALDNGAALYVAADSKIRAPADFVGKSVGYESGDDTAAIYDIILNRARLSRASIKEVPIRQAQPFSAAGIDVWPGYVGRTSLQLMSSSVPFRTLKPADFGAHLLGTVYFASETTIQRRPELMRKFLNVLIDSWENAFGNFAVSVPRVMEVVAPGLDRASVELLLNEEREILRPAGDRIGEFSQGRWTDTQNQLIQLRLLKRPVDLSKAVTFELLKDVYRRRAVR